MILEFLMATAIASTAAPAAEFERGALAAQSTADKSIESLWGRLGDAISANDTAAAIQLAKAIADHPDFDTLPSSRQAAVTATLGLLYAEEGQDASALPHLISATESIGSLDLWFARINAHGRTGDRTGAARAIEAMLRRHPSAVSDMSSTYLFQMLGDPSVDREAKFALRIALRDVDWRDEHDSMVWMGLIDDLLERDREKEAILLVPRIKGAGALIRLHAFRRYDALRAAAGLTDLDVPAVLERELSEAQAAAEGREATVRERNSYASALFARGRLEEALAVADAALALPPPAAGSPDEEMATWVMDTRARLLMELGRRDEAILQMEIAAKRDEGAGLNVSQTINLGWFYLRAGENAQAIATVKSLDRTNAAPYGVMQAMHVQACAGQALGDARVANPAFAYMERNWRDAPLTWVEAQACRGDADGAANTLLAMLADEELAEQAVSALHTYTVEQLATDYDRRISGVLAVAYARPDVIAARDQRARAFTVPTSGSQF